MWDRQGVGWAGVCKRCEARVPAIGLVPVPDRVVFGRWVQGGWFCEGCKPRAFGRVNGRSPLAQMGWGEVVVDRTPPPRDLRPRLVKRAR